VVHKVKHSETQNQNIPCVLAALRVETQERCTCFLQQGCVGLFQKVNLCSTFNCICARPERESMYARLERERRRDAGAQCLLPPARTCGFSSTVSLHVRYTKHSMCARLERESKRARTRERVWHQSFRVCTTREGARGRECGALVIPCVHDKKERVIERERERACGAQIIACVQN